MEEILRKIETKVSEYDIASELDRILREKGSNVSMELRAESMAFNFMEDYGNKDTGWGTYFGPIVCWSEDGISREFPSIKLLTKEIIDYWNTRIKETNNPILKARYSGLIWDFSQPVLGEPRNHEIGFEYVNSLIETVEQRICQHKIELITKIKRAMQVAVSLKATELIERAKLVTIELENDIAENDKPGLWGFSFDLLVGNKKINLTQEEEESIIKVLELRFDEFTSEEQLNPWNAEASVKRLVNYYRKKRNDEEVKRLIIRLGKAYEDKEKDGNAIQVSSWLQNMHKIYMDYGLTNEANAILVKLRELGPKINEELKPISSSFEIPKDELEDFINFIVKGDTNQILHNLIQHFIPKKDEVKKIMLELAKTTPLMFLIPKSIQDCKGRVVATIGSLEDDIDGNLIQYLSQSLSSQAILLRHVFDKITNENILTVADFIDFIKDSPVFEASRLTIIKEGIQAYFNRDLVVSIHLLIPQIEEAVRNLIQLSKGVVFKKNRDDVFQLKTFDGLLRDEIIKQVLGEDIQIYLRVLFTDQRGWNLRNNVCHGMSDLDSFSFQSAERILHVIIILGAIIKNESTNR